MPLLWLKDSFQAKDHNYQSKSEMKYHLQLTINDPDVHELLEPELKRFDKVRSSIKQSKIKDGCLIEIKAKDAVALRATADSVIQLLKVYEKVVELK